MQTVTEFEQQVDIIERKLEGYVEHGTDEELFLSGYLHGHFSLVVSQALLAKEYAMSALDARMRASLHNAFDAKELEQADQALALSMWERLAQS
ncbi:YfcL family protein [Aestuariibacter sp. AA17]|uniref:YfcL family protein n=1 Tax=Fluctibacter corallii TaxID=2984329 RepID=A0ABT3A323_9ALTE|nr:YfcL family protein [Aestuariibacter sp. AA17]MCV2883086.1 YfcL family protein [Aestuariibacter sp. AA17]